MDFDDGADQHDGAHSPEGADPFNVEAHDQAAPTDPRRADRDDSTSSADHRGDTGTDGAATPYATPREHANWGGHGSEVLAGVARLGASIGQWISPN